MNDRTKDILLAVVSIIAVSLAIGFVNIWNYATENIDVLLTICASLIAGLLLYRLAKRIEPMGRLARKHGFSTYLLAILPLTALSVWYTFWWLPELSGWAAALLNISVWAVCNFLHDEFPASELDYYDEIRKGNIAAAIDKSIVGVIIAVLILAAIYL